MKKGKSVKKDIDKRKGRKVNIFKKLFYVNGKFELISLLKNIAIPLLGGLLIGFITSGSMAIYDGLKKPIFTPPNYIFPIVWTILYVLMGIAAYRIYMNNKSGKKDNNAYLIYLIQLAINFLWSIVFFNFRLYGISFVLIIILLLLIVITIAKFMRVDKISGLIMIPYALWVSYATVLTYFIWLFNEM